jgi:hypothetical protein
VKLTFRISTMVLLCSLASITLTASNARADYLSLDSDSGTLSVNDGAYHSSVTWRGATITDGGVGADGAREYLVYGDFLLNSGDSLSERGGSLGVRMIVGNDATISGSINVSAYYGSRRAGGGYGGDCGRGGAIQDQVGTGGAGGAGGYSDTTGVGGVGGAANGIFGGNGGNGHPGTTGTVGAAGSAGTAGYRGNAGDAGEAGEYGFNNPNAAAGVVGGAGGAAGTPRSTDNAGTGGAGGALGHGGGVLSDLASLAEGGEGGYGGAYGGTGGRGTGGSAGRGGNGARGNGGVAPDGWALAAGSGGSGGGGAGGGGSGSGGSGGGGGGQGGGAGGGGAGEGRGASYGGGGGWGGRGGRGGDGGTGGSGGMGTYGGSGGNGGAGGGAIEIRARGALVFNGGADARGGEGQFGREPGTFSSIPAPDNYTEGEYGDSGEEGTRGGDGNESRGGHGGLNSGQQGMDGEDGEDELFDLNNSGAGGGGGCGGRGGQGGRGGSGGYGGGGGRGGASGGGAGGMVKLVGSTVSGSGWAYTAGGRGGYRSPSYQGDIEGEDGQNGRLVVGRNTCDEQTVRVNTGSLAQMTDEGDRNLGARAANPFVSSSLETPYIPGLVDGADAFGLVDVEIDPFELGAPTEAVAAAILMDEGPEGLAECWDGFDMLVLINLTDRDLDGAQLGAGDAGHLAHLLVGGYQRSEIFGGFGPEILEALPGGGVYVTLVPEGIGLVNCRIGDGDLVTESMTVGDTLFVVPEPVSAMLLAMGSVTLLARRRR